jgi:hypothetical protein
MKAAMMEVFSDEIMSIVVTGNVVRIDFGALGHVNAVNAHPVLEFRERVVMPLDGFLRSLGQVDAVIRDLVASGQIKSPSASRGEQMPQTTDMPKRFP